MKIFIMRHGEAESRAPSDSQRALTKRGQSDSISVVERALEKGFGQLDKVLVSPYVRAQQTWQTVSHLVDTKKLDTCEDITPYGDSKNVFDYVSALVEVEKLDRLLLVSHLPLVGFLTAEFVPSMAPVMFTTSGLACIEYDPISGKGHLLWHLNN